MTATMPGLDLGTLLKDIPKGAWVAISSDQKRVISYSSDMRKVLEDAKLAGEENTILTRVPEYTSALVL